MKRLLFIITLLFSLGSFCQEKKHQTTELDSISTVSKSRDFEVIAIASNVEDDYRYPVFRGCDKDFSNEELKKCSIRKIENFVKLSFDYDIADRAMPLEKSTKFKLDFIINIKGKVEQVNAKANHRAIAIEAIKTAKRIPKFKNPGILNGKPVETPFSLLMTIYFP